MALTTVAPGGAVDPVTPGTIDSRQPVPQFGMTIDSRGDANSGSVWDPVEVTAPLPVEGLQPALRELERLADGWVTSHAPRFDPFAWTNLEERHLSRKAFTELALYLYVAEGLGVTDLSPDLRKLVVNRVNDRRYRHLVRRNPRSLLKYTHPVIYARERDALDKETADAIDAVLNQRAVWAVERVPYRLMDLWHFCTVYGYSESPLEMENILDFSVLNHPPNIINSALSDSYAFTHHLFYYHNFGVDHPDFPSGPAPYDVETVLVGKILRYMAADNCDIVLELLLAGTLQRQLPRDLVRLVLSWILEKVDQLGYVPGPEDDNPEVPSIDVESWGAEDREWAQHYHTNLVAATAARVGDKIGPNLGDSSERYSLQPEEFTNLLHLGQLLDALSRYDLELAARRMKALADSSFREPYSNVFEASVTYLRRQKTSDEQYGYWTDEEAVYVACGKDRETFVEEMVRPITESCREAIREASSHGPARDEKQ